MPDKFSMPIGFVFNFLFLQRYDDDLESTSEPRTDARGIIDLVGIVAGTTDL